MTTEHRWRDLLGPPKSWLFLLPSGLVMRLLGNERALRLALDERTRLQRLGLWKPRQP
jgi:hypothetical protein